MNPQDSSQHLPPLGYSYPSGKYGTLPPSPSYPISAAPLQPIRYLADDSSPSYSGNLKQGHIIQSGVFLGLHLLSTIVLVTWIAYISAMVWLLEHTVAIGHTVAIKPWRYDVLPGLLLTIFSQSHLAITAMHLSRLALSGLHKAGTSPSTWVELFWSANKNWQGPVGVGMTLIGMVKMRVGISLSFILFALCSLLALVTPLALERTYPVEAVDVPRDILFHPNVTTSTRWVGVEISNQIGLGAGMWNSGSDVFSVYNATTYVLPGASRVAGVDNLFLSGDVKGKDATLPGIRINGSCSVDTDDHQAAMNESFTKFTDRCTSQEWGLVTQLESGEPFLTRLWDGAGHYAYCSVNGRDFAPPSGSFEALAWFSIQNTSNVDRNPGFVQGVIKCAWTINTGVAALNGRAGTFSSYVNGWDVLRTGGEPPIHPLSAALAALGDVQSGDRNSPFGGYTLGIQENSWMIRVGITKVFGGDGASVNFVLPVLEEIANRVSTGVVYMANAMNVLSSDDEIEYRAREYVTSTARVRVPLFARASYALLGTWFLLITVLTALMYRPTFGSGLDSYTVGRLLMDEPQLVRGQCCGELEDNILMKTKFHPVGDSCAARDVGHIVAGGQGPLVKGRLYGLL